MCPIVLCEPLPGVSELSKVVLSMVQSFQYFRYCHAECVQRVAYQFRTDDLAGEHSLDLVGWHVGGGVRVANDRHSKVSLLVCAHDQSAVTLLPDVNTDERQ